MSCFTYILYSRSLDRFYVGASNNVDNRLIRHNKKENAYTSQGTPWVLIWCTSKANRRAAEYLEEKLKNLSQSRKIKFMRKYTEGIIDEDLLNEIQAKS